MNLHNHFIIVQEDAQGNKKESHAYNIVTNYGRQQVLNGSTYPSTICLGSGNGVPSATDKSMFSLLKSYSVSNVTRTYDRETKVHTTKMVRLLDESELADTDITEIGIGSNGSLYTHAMFTDALGEPITIHKGALERMTITAIAYITMGTMQQETNTLALKSDIIINSAGNIATGLHGAFCLQLIDKDTSKKLPIFVNKQSYIGASYTSSTGKGSISMSLASGSGSGLLNCIGVFQTTYNYLDSSGTGAFASSYFTDECANKVAFNLDSQLFNDDMSSIETIGVGDNVTTEFSIPYNVLMPKFDVYVNDELVSNYRLEVESETTVKYNGVIRWLDMNFDKILIAPNWGYRGSTAYGNSYTVKSPIGAQEYLVLDPTTLEYEGFVSKHNYNLHAYGSSGTYRGGGTFTPGVMFTWSYANTSAKHYTGATMPTFDLICDPESDLIYYSPSKKKKYTLTSGGAISSEAYDFSVPEITIGQYKISAPTYMPNYYSTENYTDITFPSKYKIVFDSPIAEGSSVKVSRSLQSIEKTSDWQLSGSYSFGYEGF